MTAHWTWAVGPWRDGATRDPAKPATGGPQVDLAGAVSRRLTVRLLDPDEATVTLDGDSSTAAALEDLLTDLWVYRDGVALFRGRLMGPIRDDLTSATYRVTAGFADYRAVLDRRRFSNGGAETDRSWVAVEQSTVVSDLIADTQGRPGGALGITLDPAWPTTGVPRTVTWTPSDSIGEAIKKLGQLSNGFDFHIDGSLVAHLYYPRRGATNGVVLDYGGVVSTVARTFASDGFANAVRQSGADGIAPTVTTVAAIDAAPEGRWDAQFSDTQLSGASVVAAAAAANLNRASMVQPGYGLTLERGAWQGPGHVWVGDEVLVVVRRGRLRDVATMRVYELDIDVDSSGESEVTITVGDVRLDARSVLRGIAKRLAALAKR